MYTFICEKREFRILKTSTSNKKAFPAVENGHASMNAYINYESCIYKLEYSSINLGFT